MRLDTYVHSKPDFYQRKLDVISAIKSGIYTTLGFGERVAERRREIEERNSALQKKHLSGKRVLEIGCGAGRFLASAQRSLGFQGHGVDISSEMIESAKSANPGPSYSVMDSSNLEFEDDTFDYVLFNYVLHHVDDLEGTIREARRVARHIIIYECAAFGREPLQSLSVAYWKAIDGGFRYLSLDDPKARIGWPVIDEIAGSGLIRYGMCVFQKPA